MTDTSTTALRIVLHAADAESLARARASALNARKAQPDANVRIVANAAAVAAALDTPHEGADPLTGLCPNTLAATARSPRAPLTVLGQPAVIELALLQRAGWAYIRA